MDKYDRYRRKSDGAVVEAVQYNLAGAVSKIAAFVLKMDVDDHITVANEHLLDVVRPVHDAWNPNSGVATIHVVDPGTGFIFPMLLNEWLARCDNGALLTIKPNAFIRDYEKIQPEAPKSEYDELADVIYESFATLEGELYQALAERAASAVIKAGWKRGV